jgi:hypothetical protein
VVRECGEGEEVPGDAMTVSLLKHQVDPVSCYAFVSFVHFRRPSSLLIGMYTFRGDVKEKGIILDAFPGEKSILRRWNSGG